MRTHQQQELTQALKNVTTDAKKGNYGSSDGSDEIIINKSSSKWYLTYLPLIIAVIALIISLVNTGMITVNKNDTTDAMNTAQSSKTSVGHLSRNFILSQFNQE
eukprot:761087_1